MIDVAVFIVSSLFQSLKVVQVMLDTCIRFIFSVQQYLLLSHKDICVDQVVVSFVGHIKGIFTHACNPTILILECFFIYNYLLLVEYIFWFLFLINLSNTFNYYELVFRLK